MSIASIAAFGASTTFGFVDTSGKGGWAGRLKRWFEMQNPTENRLYNLAIDGDTTRGLVKRLEKEAKPREPDLILISMLVNDASHYPKSDSPCTVPLPEFARNLTTAIRLSRRFTKHVVFLTPNPVDETKTSPTPWGWYYFLADERQYCDMARKVCRKENIPCIDIFTDWTQKRSGYGHLLYDGLHANDKGHEAMFKFVIKSLQDLGIFPSSKKALR